MNKKGYTLAELLAVIVVIALLMMIILPNVVKIQKQNDEKKFNEYEKMMIEYAEIYKGNNTLLTLQDLNNLGLKGIIEDGCLGYVMIDYNTNPYTYNSYISCGEDYTTSGYNSSLLS